MDYTETVEILRRVRAAGSGTISADRALDKWVYGSQGSAVTPRKLARMRALTDAVGCGWLLYGDGEPAALTLTGALELQKGRAEFYPAAAKRSVSARLTS